jgi:hypothetical protein
LQKYGVIGNDEMIVDELTGMLAVTESGLPEKENAG